MAKFKVVITDHEYDNIENEKNIDFSFATEVTRGGFAYILFQCLLKNY